MSIKLEVGKKYLDNHDNICTVLCLGKAYVFYSLDDFGGFVENIRSLRTVGNKWKEYTEPKKMVKMYQYAYLLERDGYRTNWSISTRYFKHVPDFLTECGGEYSKIERLDYTMIEVEE